MCMCVCVFHMFVYRLPLWKDWRAWGDTGGGVRVSARCLCPLWHILRKDAEFGPYGTRRIPQEWNLMEFGSFAKPSFLLRNAPRSGATGLLQWWYDKDTRPLGPRDRPLSWHTGVDCPKGWRLTRTWQGDKTEDQFVSNCFTIRFYMFLRASIVSAFSIMFPPSALAIVM